MRIKSTTPAEIEPKGKKTVRETAYCLVSYIGRQRWTTFEDWVAANEWLAS